MVADFAADAGRELLQANALDILVHDMNTFFVMSNANLIFFMHAGFAMLSLGSVRAKNAKNILLKILLDAAFAAIGFWATGFAFAYGEGNGFIGHEFFFFLDFPASRYYEWFVQFAFAATAATIVSGAVAERTQFVAYMIYSFFLTMWVYPVAVHWVWAGDGWASAANKDPLFGSGVIDFAGCSVVHMIGAVAGLCGAKVEGPRIGRYDAKGNAVEMPGHDSGMALLGIFILWFGWYGFNPGSTLAIVGTSEIVSHSAITTTISGATGAIVTLFYHHARTHFGDGTGIFDLTLAANGLLAGLVSITSGCSTVHVWAAIPIGFIGALVYYHATDIVTNVLKVDDPLEAVAVHGGCGAWGLLATGFFAAPELVQKVYGHKDAGGALYGFGNVLGANFVFLLVVAAWTAAFMYPFFMALHAAHMLRVPEEEELEGLDLSHHGGNAYPEDASVGGGADITGLVTQLQLLKQEVAELKGQGKDQV